jgi:glycosyltransferase involved in cell wall biosynthesis
MQERYRVPRAFAHSLSIVIPVFNEEESLRPLHQEITETLQQTPENTYEVLFVDDGSSDGSYDVARELHEKDPEHVALIGLRRNFGQTAAMAAGFDAARGDIIIAMDADLQNDPADIPRMLEKVDEGFEVVSGWRVRRRDRLFSRRVPSLIANRLISWITGVRLHDYGCTLKAYTRHVTENVNLYGEMHRFLPALASWAGARVTEIEVNHRDRRFGESHYRMDRTLRVILDLITVKFLVSYSTKPMQVFGRWGIYAIGLGLLFGALTAALKVLPPHQDVTGNPWMYLCIFLLLSGLQLVGMGLLGEISARTYYESQKKPIYTVREVRRATAGTGDPGH